MGDEGSFKGVQHKKPGSYKSLNSQIDVIDESNFWHWLSVLDMAEIFFIISMIQESKKLITVIFKAI